MKHICILITLVFLVACEKKETTVTNPPAESKTESNTTVIDKTSSPAPATAPATSTETNTTINTGASPSP